MSTRALRTSAAIAAIAAAAGLIGVPAGTAVATARPTAAKAIAPPQRSGALRIAGLAQDGNMVKAAGLRWRPGRLPKGDRLLSFGVAFYWKICEGFCQSGSDSTATPFAASKYIVGHADTGRKLQLTETATEVVQTRRAPFSFSVLNASATVKTRRVVRAYPPGARRAPNSRAACPSTGPDLARSTSRLARRTTRPAWASPSSSTALTIAPGTRFSRRMLSQRRLSTAENSRLGRIRSPSGPSTGAVRRCCDSAGG